MPSPSCGVVVIFWELASEIHLCSEVFCCGGSFTAGGVVCNSSGDL